MKFYLDEHINPAVGEGLKLRGIDIKTTKEARKLSATDIEQLELAFLEKRIIVTADRDFLVLASENRKHKGIVFITDNRISVGELVRKLESLNIQVTETEMENKVKFV